MEQRLTHSLLCRKTRLNPRTEIDRKVDIPVCPTPAFELKCGPDIRGGPFLCVLSGTVPVAGQDASAELRRARVGKESNNNRGTARGV